MASHHKRDQWMDDIEARQRNVVFPNTVENETRFWRNLGTGPSSTPAKLGLAVLAIFVFSFAAVILVATYEVGVIWLFLLTMLLFCGLDFFHSRTVTSDLALIPKSSHHGRSRNAGSRPESLPNRA